MAAKLGKTALSFNKGFSFNLRNSANSILQRIPVCSSCQRISRFNSFVTVTATYTFRFSRLRAIYVASKQSDTHSLSKEFSSSSNHSFLLNSERMKGFRNVTDRSVANNLPRNNLWERLKDSLDETQDVDTKENGKTKTKLVIKSSDAIQSWLDNRKDKSPIWANYRRNHKGQLAPEKTRKKCIRGKIVCGNPCPICQLSIQLGYTISHLDVTLLDHFVCPHSGLILQPSKTGVCREQQKKLEDAIEKARDCGLMPFTVPGPRDAQKRFKPAGIPPKIKNKM